MSVLSGAVRYWDWAIRGANVSGSRAGSEREGESGKMMGAKSSDFLLPHDFALIILLPWWKAVAWLGLICVCFASYFLNGTQNGFNCTKYAKYVTGDLPILEL